MASAPPLPGRAASYLFFYMVSTVSNRSTLVVDCCMSNAKGMCSVPGSSKTLILPFLHFFTARHESTESTGTPYVGGGGSKPSPPPLQSLTIPEPTGFFNLRTTTNVPRGIGRVGPAASRYTRGLTLDLHVRHVPSRVEVTAHKVQGVANDQCTYGREATQNIGGRTGTVA